MDELYNLKRQTIDLARLTRKPIALTFHPNGEYKITPIDGVLSWGEIIIEFMGFPTTGVPEIPTKLNPRLLIE